jgi:hypothetical protein
LDKLEKNQNRVGPTVSPTVRTEAPGPHRARSDSGGHRLVHAHGFARRFHRHSCPPFPPPSATASCGFKSSAPSKSSSILLAQLPPRPYSPRHSPLPPLHLVPMRSRHCSFPKPPATASLMRLLPPRARSSSSHSSKCRQREGHRLIPCPSSTAVWISYSDHPPRPPSPP